MTHRPAPAYSRTAWRSLERQLAELRPAFAKPFITIAAVTSAHFEDELHRIESLGGEGLMLRQPGSRYEAGRSATLLKVKRFHDAEARVIGHRPAPADTKAGWEALLVVLPDGTEFAVGTGLRTPERSIPPPVGSLITFRYQELTDRGVPRFPSFVASGADLSSPQSNGSCRVPTFRVPSTLPCPGERT